MAKDVYTKIEELVNELGTVESHRQELALEIRSLEEELTALDQMAEDATDREEFESITAQRKEAELDLRLARNRLRLFGQAPRVSREQLADLLGQLGDEADAAAKVYRQKVEKPLAEVVKAGDEFDATITVVRGAVRKLASVTGPAIERDYNLLPLRARHAPLTGLRGQWPHRSSRPQGRAEAGRDGEAASVRHPLARAAQARKGPASGPFFICAAVGPRGLGRGARRDSLGGRLCGRPPKSHATQAKYIFLQCINGGHLCYLCIACVKSILPRAVPP